MSVESEVVAMLAATQKAFGKVDILVNNAGVYAFSAIEAVTRRLQPTVHHQCF
ncbi:hypothetical protein PAMC26510_35950 [Caballeronia sordidicola]|uniref:3-oxoacyl-[acyl-carrier protein] reductase n=1 Tax=Caballeronia sordidicola TaxID=196367 RepID=A0A242M4P7_CABSO|nr:hypothetical protein PAMC26510_35950 [Caballeronia sordidicola]